MARRYQKNPKLEAARLARRQAMAELYRSGKTLAEIGELYGTTRVNIGLQLRRIGLSGADGGRTARKSAARARAFAEKNERCLQRHGCTIAELKALKASGAKQAYRAHKSNAAARDIGWEFNLGQWWAVWEKSGKWDQRGPRPDQFVMCRYGDVGPYAAHNVFIATARENLAESRARRA